jgi:hypothetical protein
VSILYTCEWCLLDHMTPHGWEHDGYIQLYGVWLCKMHYDIAMESFDEGFQCCLRRFPAGLPLLGNYLSAIRACSATIERNQHEKLHTRQRKTNRRARFY